MIARSWDSPEATPRVKFTLRSQKAAFKETSEKIVSRSLNFYAGVFSRISFAIFSLWTT